MSNEWRNKYEKSIQKSISSIRLCLVYESMDEIVIKDKIESECKAGPEKGDLIYRGGDEFIVHREEYKRVSLIEAGGFSITDP